MRFARDHVSVLTLIVTIISTVCTVAALGLTFGEIRKFRKDYEIATNLRVTYPLPRETVTKDVTVYGTSHSNTGIILLYAGQEGAAINRMPRYAAITPSRTWRASIKLPGHNGTAHTIEALWTGKDIDEIERMSPGARPDDGILAEPLVVILDETR